MLMATNFTSCNNEDIAAYKQTKTTRFSRESKDYIWLCINRFLLVVKYIIETKEGFNRIYVMVVLDHGCDYNFETHINFSGEFG